MNAPQILDRVPGLTYRQLDHWCRKGYLGEALQSPGNGSSREFTVTHLMELKLVVRLMAAGLTFTRAWELAKDDDNWSDDGHQYKLAEGVVLMLDTP